MKSLSDNLLVFALAFVLGISPLQSIAASVSGCMDSGQSMHHHMNNSKMVMSADVDKNQTDSQHGCCEKSTCDMSHCVGTIATVISSGSLNDLTNTVSNIYLKPRDLLLSFFPSSLYRPPKV